MVLVRRPPARLHRRVGVAVRGQSKPRSFQSFNPRPGIESLPCSERPSIRSQQQERLVVIRHGRFCPRHAVPALLCPQPPLPSSSTIQTAHTHLGLLQSTTMMAGLLYCCNIVSLSLCYPPLLRWSPSLQRRPAPSLIQHTSSKMSKHDLERIPPHNWKTFSTLLLPLYTSTPRELRQAPSPRHPTATPQLQPTAMLHPSSNAPRQPSRLSLLTPQTSKGKASSSSASSAKRPLARVTCFITRIQLVTARG